MGQSLQIQLQLHCCLGNYGSDQILVTFQNITDYCQALLMVGFVYNGHFLRKTHCVLHLNSLKSMAMEQTDPQRLFRHILYILISSVRGIQLCIFISIWWCHCSLFQLFWEVCSSISLWFVSCLSLTVNDVEDLFMCLRAIGIHINEMSVHIFCPFSNWIIFYC